MMQVVEWVLGGVRTEWQSPAFQAGVDSPAAFIGHYFNLHADANGNVEVQTWQKHSAAVSAADCSTGVAACRCLLPVGMATLCAPLPPAGLCFWLSADNIHITHDCHYMVFVHV